MDKPTPEERILHIIDAIRSIREFVAGIDEALFMEDKMIQAAVQYQFLIIGEAIRHVDESILVKYIYPWHIPRSFRNYIIHVYHGIKLERIYYATQDLDALENVVNEIRINEF